MEYLAWFVGGMFFMYNNNDYEKMLLEQIKKRRLQRKEMYEKKLQEQIKNVSMIKATKSSCVPMVVTGTLTTAHLPMAVWSTTSDFPTPFEPYTTQ